jgi:competence protein ComEC
MFGVGIAVYFALGTEPTTLLSLEIAGLGLFAALFIRPQYIIRTAILGMLLLTCLGYSYAAHRTTTVKAPILTRHYYGPVYGRIIGLDRSATNAPRVLLDQIYLPEFSAARTPERVRISLQGYIPDETLTAGGRIAVTASISPPSPPVEPGGFDFRRMAWFMRLGGVGYTRNPVIPAYTEPASDFKVWLFSLRMQISTKIKNSVEGQNGAFAAAIITGDRSDIDPEILVSLRASNLAHLLAISGLHMGMLSGFVFAIFRYGFAIFPYLALRVRPKKLAAGLAIIAGAGYLMLSGASVATQRAFIMTAVVLFAVILDKPAFTLRAVALAAFIVLLIKPYSLLEAGFQMSFAATTALISAYEWLNQRQVWRFLSRGKWKYVKPAIALLFTSAVAGAATAPISAFHFNQISQYGLAANLLAVPIMGMVVMPSAVIAFILTPFDLESYAFWVTGEGIGAILAVAEYFSNLEGAVTNIKSSSPVVLAGIVTSGLILFLWKGRGRSVGVIMLVLTIFIWSKSNRPSVLISEDGRMLGLMTESNRVVNKPRGSGYSVRIWLENDGDIVTQAEAALREGINGEKHSAIAELSDGWRIYLYLGDEADVASENCTEKTILVISKLSGTAGNCIVIDKNYLRRSGAISINMVEGTPMLKHSRDTARNRPWGY